MVGVPNSVGADLGSRLSTEAGPGVGAVTGRYGNSMEGRGGVEIGKVSMGILNHVAGFGVIRCSCTERCVKCQLSKVGKLAAGSMNM